MTRKRLTLYGRKVVGGVAEGEALVTHDTISGWGGVNPMKGTIIETRHELHGQSFQGKVLVFPGAKGSSGWSGAFHLARLTGMAPKALVFNEMTTKIALGAVVMRVPAVTGLDQDPLTVIETGDWVRVDGDRGTVEVLKSALRPGTPERTAQGIVQGTTPGTNSEDDLRTAHHVDLVEHPVGLAPDEA